MAKKKEVRLKKIPLEIFLDALEELYNMGLEYIDIVGINGEEQDTIGLAYSKDYMSQDLHEDIQKAMDEIEKYDNEIKKDIKLSDDDLNQLT
jgi:hypothetical protein